MATSDTQELHYLPLHKSDKNLVEEYEKYYEKINFTWIEKFGLVLSFFTYFFDVSSDVYLAISYYRNGDLWYFGLTFVFILVPAVVMSVFSYFEYRNYANFMWHQKFPALDKKITVFRQVCTCLLISPVSRYVEAWVYGQRYMTAKIKNHKEKTYMYFVFMYVEQRTAMVFRLIESFIESAPQLTLQLYIMTARAITNESESWTMVTQTFSIATSMFSLALTVTTFRSLIRSLDVSIEHEEETTWLGKGVLLVAHLFGITARVLALSVFATVFGWIVFPMLLMHMAGILISLYLLKLDLIIKQVEHLNNKKTFSETEKFFLNTMMAIVLAFTYIHSNGRLRHRYYMAICFVENSIMVSLWLAFSGHDSLPLFRYFIFSGHYACFIASILFFGFFYRHERRINEVANMLRTKVANWFGLVPNITNSTHHDLTTPVSDFHHQFEVAPSIC